MRLYSIKITKIKAIKNTWAPLSWELSTVHFQLSPFLLLTIFFSSTFFFIVPLLSFIFTPPVFPLFPSPYCFLLCFSLFLYFLFNLSFSLHFSLPSFLPSLCLYFPHFLPYFSSIPCPLLSTPLSYLSFSTFSLPLYPLSLLLFLFPPLSLFLSPLSTPLFSSSLSLSAPFTLPAFSTLFEHPLPLPQPHTFSTLQICNFVSMPVSNITIHSWEYISWKWTSLIEIWNTWFQNDAPVKNSIYEVQKI